MLYKSTFALLTCLLTYILWTCLLTWQLNYKLLYCLHIRNQSIYLRDHTASVVFSLNLMKSSANASSKELKSWKICFNCLSSPPIWFTSIEPRSDCSWCLIVASRARSCCHTIQCCFTRFCSFCCREAAWIQFSFSSDAWPASLCSAISHCSRS